MSNRSENVQELIKALIEAEKEFATIEKNCSGQSGGGKFKYADLTQIYNATKPALNKYGLKVMGAISILEDGSNCISAIIFHTSGQYIESKMKIVHNTAKPSDLGSIFTYMRRYLYSTLLGIAADEDVEGDQLNKSTEPEKPQLLSQESIYALAEKLHELDNDFELSEIEAYLNVSVIRERLKMPISECAIELSNNEKFKPAFLKWSERNKKNLEKIN